ncbi:alpha/beta fold hydrolase [Crossiella sp. CA198]|uniref:alpha/beta fold hydrolase n=1 Tax=Crossiella sp. CA198 TaxID=3455607 RepID=UPI003F8D71C7
MDVRIPVGLDLHVAGELRTPVGATDTIHLAVPGGYYGRGYWLVRADGPSYADTMVGAGHAVLTVDRLGAGDSSRPPSAELRGSAHIDSMHHLVQALRAGEVDGVPYRRVIFVAHSFSIALALALALRFPGDLDGVILTGGSSQPNQKAYSGIAAHFHPAARDSRFADRGLDPGYLTSIVGTRAGMFLYPGTVDDRLVELDEELTEPDVIPDYEVFPGTEEYPNLRVPVLVVLGDRDVLFTGEGATDCSSSASLLAAERVFYGDGVDLTAFAVPETGHSLNLHRTAFQWYEAARDWALRIG